LPYCLAFSVYGIGKRAARLLRGLVTDAWRQRRVDGFINRGLQRPFAAVLNVGSGRIAVDEESYIAGLKTNGEKDFCLTRKWRK